MKFLDQNMIYLLTLLLVSVSVFGQTEPYYKLPKDRTEKGVKTFPNLNPALTKFYLRGEGGFLLQGSSLSNNFSEQLTTNLPVNINWGASLGYNYRDRWMVDIGYATTPLQLSSLLRINPFSIPIREQYDLNGISLRYQRSVFVVDRVARSTRLFIGGGLIMSTNGKSAEVSNSAEAFLRRYSQTTADTIRLAETTRLAPTPVMGEVSVELRGKLAEVLEIGAYVKLLSNFSRPLKTNLSYQVNNSLADQTIQTISPLAVRLGIVIHYNFGIITKYESNIE